MLFRLCSRRANICVGHLEKFAIHVHFSAELLFSVNSTKQSTAKTALL